MIKLKASPDMHYGVTLSNGVSKMGSRKAIIKTAVEAAKEGIAVVAWTVPGKLKISRHHRGELVHAEYQADLEVL
jgi:hypothetical protein